MCGGGAADGELGLTVKWQDGALLLRSLFFTKRNALCN